MIQFAMLYSTVACKISDFIKEKVVKKHTVIK